MSPASPASAASPRRTALYPLHLNRQGKMVDFAGYSMPLQFAAGIKAEHLHTRAHAGLFDVSHMGQIHIRGDAACTALEHLVTGDIPGLADHQQRYTLLTNAAGGIMDDLMVAKVPGGLELVVNAATREQDVAYLESALPPGCELELMQDRALLALQGPQAVQVLTRHAPGIATLHFMRGGRYRIAGMDCTVTRCGYTGEDGFEISIDSRFALALAELILADPAVWPIGLGARDSLRLEAGLCLYGHDIDPTTSPVEANLAWTIAAKYRRRLAQATFPGAEIILRQLQTGTRRCLVGLRPEGKVPVREGAVVLNMAAEEQGRVTSGGFGPSLDGPLAMAYVAREYSQCDTELQVEIRNRFHTMRVAELPFVKHRYHKP